MEISPEKIVDLLDLPSEFEAMTNKVMIPSITKRLVVRTKIKRRLVAGKLTDEVIERKFDTITSPTSNSFTLLNYMVDQIHYWDAKPTDVAGEYLCPANIRPDGFFNGWRIGVSPTKVVAQSKGIFMNIESQAKDGAIGDTDGKFTGEKIPYEKGWCSFEELKDIDFVFSSRRTRKPGTGINGIPLEWNVIEQTRKITEKGRIVLTKDQIEAMGYTDEGLAEMAFQSWDLVDRNPQTHLVNVALELQPAGESDDLFVPVVYINGKEHTDINYRDLITPWGFKFPDFTLKICGHGDLTVEDLFDFDSFGRAIPKADQPVFATSENPTLLGVGGKFVERVFENENAPLIRVIEGDQYGSFVDSDGILNVRFKAGDERKVLAFHIALKPDTGKSDFYHVYMDLNTLVQRVKL